MGQILFKTLMVNKNWSSTATLLKKKEDLWTWLIIRLRITAGGFLIILMHIHCSTALMIKPMLSLLQCTKVLVILISSFITFMAVQLKSWDWVSMSFTDGSILKFKWRQENWIIKTRSMETNDSIKPWVIIWKMSPEMFNLIC